MRVGVGLGVKFIPQYKRAGESWAPGEVASATLVRAYESDWGITLDEGVAIWADRAGNADRIQNTGAKKPDLVAGIFGGGTLPAVQGDGSDDILEETGLQLAGQFTCFWVVRAPSLNEFLEGDSTVANNFIHITATGQVALMLDGTTGNVGGTGTLAIDTIYILTLSRNGSNEINLRRNSVDVTVAGPPTRTGTFRLGAFGTFKGGSNYSEYQYGAGLYYDGALSTDDRDAVESYLGRYL